ncbi:tetratricopeptide repeat protein 4-like [Asterias amurensis]|uniref:tetratricopeptide repeat protein 4-like n=1 Tax=Asterias amurensis TaxID=7602 RepID=UPI003AB4AAAC
MADNTSDNVGAIGDGDDSGVKPVVDHQGLFEKYAAEAASHPKYTDEERNERKQEEKEYFRNNWEEEMKKIPIFSSEMPEEPSSEDADLFAAFQAIKYAEDDPPEELAGSHKDDGNQWFKKKKYKLAIKAYDEGLKLKFDDGNLRAVLYTNRAAANFHLGNHRSSLNDATKAIEHNPNHMKALVRGAECCMKLEKYKDATTWCDNALQIAADDKRVLEMRSTAVKHLKVMERDQRKRKAEEKSAKAKSMKIVEAIKSRNIEFAQTPNESNEENTRSPKIKTQEQLIVDVVTATHPTGAKIHLDESGRLSWPVTFLYPEHGQSDFIAAFHEDSRFSDHLKLMFDEGVPWDTMKVYKTLNLQVYFHYSEGKALVQINPESSLNEIIRDPRYLVAHHPLFVVLPRASPFTSDYLKKYSSLL